MSNVLVGLVGDVIVNREHPAEAFNEVRDVLQAPDIMFANLGCAYTDNPRPVPATLVIGPAARNLDVYSQVGFDVVSMANNHILDMGYEAMLETRARLRDQGVKTCGAGDCEADARQPAIMEVNDVRVAFLGYASVFPMGYEARHNTPGLVPMRAYNLYRDLFPGFYLPGYAPVVTTVPDQDDLAKLADDIHRARECADLVVTSFRWGDFTRPFHLTDHETRTARYCIDQGADMVVGFLHHALRGMEWYKGKPIMYGLGHFVIDSRLEFSEELKRAYLEPGREDTSYQLGPRQGWPLLPFHKDTRMTVMAWAYGNRDGISDVGFLPCRLTADGLIHPLRLDSIESDEVVEYIKRCNRTQGIKSTIVSGGSLSIAGLQTLRVLPD